MSRRSVRLFALFGFLALPALATAQNQALPTAPQPKTDQEQQPSADKPQGPANPSLKVIGAHAPYVPITAGQRFQWWLVTTFGPESLLTGTLSAGLGTARDKPPEYGPHWDGFAKRYGMRFTGVASSNAIEAGLGSIWGEDPRYVRDATLPFKHRIVNVFKYSFFARNREGDTVPAYARYIAIPGNNFLSNTWRVSSESNTSAALSRTGYGILGEIGSNAWAEFWPDVKQRVFHRH